MSNIITDINKIIELSRQAGKTILEFYSSDYDIVTKTDNSPVTLADITADKLIVAGLKEIAPDIPVISEEGNKILPEGADKFWLVDPLDGTKGFINKTGQFTVNIGLIENGKPTLGVIYIPTEDKMYWGFAKDNQREAYLDGKRIQCRSKPQDGLVVVGSKNHRDAQTDAYVQHLNVKEFLPAASSLKFCMLAEGVADLYPRFGTTMEWDVAAGHAILTAAGGTIHNPDGSEFQYNKPDFRNSGGFIANGKSLKNGFTLVELSIVLVVIGLLIGGILVGQSLIESSRLSATVKQINEFDTGVFAYTSKFKYLPGDNPRLGTIGGNGDGIIESRPNIGGAGDPSGGYVSMAGTRLSCETERFWNHLFPEQYVASTNCARNATVTTSFANHDGVQAQTSGAGKNVPASKLGKSGSFFIVTSVTGDGGWVKSGSINVNYYMVLDPTQAQNSPFNTAQTTDSNSSYKPQQLAALDAKIDDGSASAGNVRVGSIDEYGYIGVTRWQYYPATCANWASGKYVVISDTFTCTPFIRVGGVNGNPK